MGKTEKLDDTTIAKIQELYHDKGRRVEEISKELGISVGAISKYINIPKLDVTGKPPEQPPKTVKVLEENEPPESEQPPDVKLKPVMPYKEIEEPWEFLRNFLTKWKLNQTFIYAMGSRVKRSSELPTPGMLAADIREMASGQSNPRMCAEIADDYYYDLSEYMRRREEFNATLSQPYRHGIPLGNPNISYDERYAVPVSRFDQRNYPPYNQNLQPTTPYQYDPYTQRGIPVAPTAYYPPQQYIESNLEQFIRLQKLLHSTEERNPTLERLEKEKEELKARLSQLEIEKRQETIEELSQTRAAYQSEKNKSDALMERLRSLEFQQSQKGISELDIRMQEVKDKKDLELTKIEEKGKNREMISNIARNFTAQIGEVIARTMQDVGTGETRTMEMVHDTKNTFQSNCPFCNTIITAPISARTVTCPGCGRQLTTEEEQPIQHPAKIVPEERTPVESIETECPSCHNLLRIPSNARRVECPYCFKKLTVSSPEEPRHIEEPVTPPQQAKVSYEIPTGPQIETELEEQLAMPEQEDEKLPDWREQVKEPKKPATIKKLKKDEEPKQENDEIDVDSFKRDSETVEEKPFTVDGYVLKKFILPNGVEAYRFAKPDNPKGELCYKLPDGYELDRMKTNNFPIVKKKK